MLVLIFTVSNSSKIESENNVGSSEISSFKFYKN